MQVIEEQLILNGISFAKSEIEEISNFCTLNNDGLTYSLQVAAAVIRANPVMQKALHATLFISPNGSDIIASPDLQGALERYKT